MASARKKITLKEKSEILKEIDKGVKVLTICKQRKLTESTVRTIKKNRNRIEEAVRACGEVGASSSSNVRNVTLIKMENALSLWIKDCAQKKIPLDVKSIKAKAAQFYKNLIEDLDEGGFSYSNGWLNGFIKRFSFHNVKISGESASADQNAANNFPQILKETIARGGYVADQIFNADETALFWKKMPKRTYISKSESNAKGFKASKERITLLLCSNASGNKMLKPLVVNKHLKPRALKSIDRQKMLVHFMANTRAWVTSALFTEWFYECFIPEVKTYLIEKQLDFKVLLIVDNAPGHPKIEHPNVEILFLPPNTTSLIQPLDQGIIASFKAHYIKHSFSLILKRMENDHDFNVLAAWKTFTLKDCIDCINNAVKNISATTLNNCWKKIWPEAVDVEVESNSLGVYADIFEIAHDIGGEGFEDIGIEDLNELFENEVIADADILETIAENCVNQSDAENIENVPVPADVLTAAKLRKGLQMASELQSFFLLNDHYEERSSKFVLDLKNTMKSYQKEYEKKKQDLPQKLVTDYF